MPTITLATIVDAPIDDVFAFHLDTRNAARISPRGSRVVSVEGVFPLVAGAEVRLVVRPLPLPLVQRWHVLVEQVVEPTLVVDRMLSGPFAEWVHEHRFTAIGADRTLLEDRVAYRLPGGRLGVPAAPIAGLVLRNILAQRQARTRTLLARGPG